MAFDFWHNLKRERAILKLMKALAKQRVAMILHPNNIWVIEYAAERTEANRPDFLTCLLRGWIEVYQEKVSTGKVTNMLDSDGRYLFDSKETIFRLTESGWAVINRSHQWAVLRVLAATVSAMIALYKLPVFETLVQLLK